MPGSLQAAQPSTVMPAALSSLFTETQTFDVEISGPYADGRTQRNPMATTVRRSWEIGRRLTFTEWTALLAFFEARLGSLEPFFFYPLLAHHDPTGQSATGRFVVRFADSLSRTLLAGRNETRFRLIEVA